MPRRGPCCLRTTCTRVSLAGMRWSTRATEREVQTVWPVRTPQSASPVRRRGAGRWERLRFSPRRSRWSRSATGCFRGSMSCARRCRPWTARSIPGSGAEMRLIPAGYEIRNGDEVRTAKGSTAVVRLLDGSLVEMGERSDLSVSRAMEGHDDSSGWRPGHCAGGEADVRAGCMSRPMMAWFR